MLVERRFDGGATIVAEGEPGRSMYIVHSGELAVSKLADSGHVLRMAGLEPGDFFGEMTLIEIQNRSATVVAESPAVLYEIARARSLDSCPKENSFGPEVRFGSNSALRCFRLHVRSTPDSGH